MSLLPATLIDALAGKIAGAIGPTLQSTLGSIVGKTAKADTGIVSRVLRAVGVAKPDQQEGQLQQQLKTIYAKQDQPKQTVKVAKEQGTRQRQQTVKTTLSQETVNRVVQTARKVSASDQAESGQSWWKRGWSRLSGTKPNAVSRASRLTVKATKRLSRADKAVRGSAKNKGLPGFNEYAHGQLLAGRRAAQQRLAQAIGLQAKAMGLGAGASGKVASGLMTLASKIPNLIGPVALATTAGVAIAKLPFMLSHWNDNQIESQRENARFSPVTAGAFARYDERSLQLKSLTARDTEKTTSRLVDEQNKLRSSLRPVLSAIENVKNFSLSQWTKKLNENITLAGLTADWFKAAGQEMAEKGLAGINNEGIANRAVKNIMDRQKEDELTQSKEITQQFEAWVSGLDAVQNARINNVPKRSLPPMK